jgi:type II secretory pathway component PulF
MPVIVLPIQFERRAELFHQLGSLLSAGLPAMQCLDQLQRNPPARSFRQPLQRAMQFIQQGETFTASLSRSGTWLTRFDLALLEASEKSGRLDAAFKLLAGYYRERAVLARQMLSAMAYPVFILGFASLIFPISLFQGLILRGEVAPFLLQKLAVFSVIFGVPLVLTWAVQGRRGERWREVIDAVCSGIPILGKARHQLALARLCAALEALLNAGVNIDQAWTLAAAASGSPRLQKAVATWQPQLDLGRTPAELVRDSDAFPDLFQSLYASAEISGQHDQVLERLHRHYSEESSRNLQLVAEWAPRIVYLVIVIYVASQIIQFYGAYFSGASNLL